MSGNIQLINDLEESVAATDDDRVPWRLRAITFLFTLTGTLSLVEVCLLFLVKGSIFLDLNAPIALLTAWGLHRRREGGRQAAVFFVSLFLVGAAFIVATAIYAVITGSVAWGVFHVMDRSIEPVLAAVAAAGFALLTFWMLKVLRSPPIRKYFRERATSHELTSNGRSLNSPRRFQFTLRSMLLLTLIVAFVLIRVTQGELIYGTDNQTQVVARNGSVQKVHYGIRTNLLWQAPQQLKYVVFSGSADGWTDVSVITTGGASETLVMFANGTQTLSGRNQLYEVKNNQLVTRRWERVTLEEFQDFLSSGSDEWTIDVLLEHAKQMREMSQSGASKKSP